MAAPGARSISFVDRGLRLICLLDGDAFLRGFGEFELDDGLREIDRAGRAFSAFGCKPPGKRQQLLQGVPVQAAAAPVEHEQGLLFAQCLRKPLFQLLRLRERDASIVKAFPIRAGGDGQDEPFVVAEDSLSGTLKFNLPSAI